MVDWNKIHLDLQNIILSYDESLKHKNKNDYDIVEDIRNSKKFSFFSKHEVYLVKVILKDETERYYLFGYEDDEWRWLRLRFKELMYYDDVGNLVDAGDDLV